MTFAAVQRYALTCNLLLVPALLERVGREQSRLDVLAIVMTGQPASWKSFVDEAPADRRLNAIPLA